MKPAPTARQIITVFGDLRVCLLAVSADTSPLAGPREWNSTGTPVIVETQREGDFRRMMIARDRIEWTINGQPRTADSAAMAWRAIVVDLLEPAWEAAGLRATVGQLTADRDSMPVRRKRLRADILALERRVNQVRLQISDLQSRDRAIGSEISSLESRLGTLVNQATTQRIATGSTDAATRTRAESALRRLESEIASLENRLGNVERQRQSLDPERKVGELELELRTLRPDHTLAFMRLRLAEMTPASEAAAMRELADLQPESRLRAFDEKVQQALDRLRAALPPA